MQFPLTQRRKRRVLFTQAQVSVFVLHLVKADTPLRIGGARARDARDISRTGDRIGAEGACPIAAQLGAAAAAADGTTCF